MVLVEDLARALEVEGVLGRLRPGQREDPVDVGADDAVLGRRGRQLLEPRELALDRLLCLLGQVLLRDPLAQLVQLGLLRVPLAELVLDRLQLLAEEVLALALLELGLDLRLDLRAELHHFQLAFEDAEHVAQPGGHVALLEQRLLLVGLQAQGRGDEVRERARVVDVRGRELELGRQVGDERDQAAELGLHAAGERLELGRLLDLVRHLLELADEVRLVLDALGEPDAADALDEDPQRPVGDADHLVHDARRANVVEVVPGGRVGVPALDRDQRQHPLALEHVVDELHRPLLPDRKRRDGLREDDGLLEREHRQRRRDLELPLVEGLVEVQLAHAMPLITIETRSVCCTCGAIGNTTVSIPFS